MSKSFNNIGRMLVADFDGMVRDGATFVLNRCTSALRNGDMVMFDNPEDRGTGINVEEDDRGLCAFISFDPLATLRIGLNQVSDGRYAFRPDPHHLELWPALSPDGAGLSLNPWRHNL